MSFESPRAKRIVAIAALTEALDMIGRPESSDHGLAKIIVDHHSELLGLAHWALTHANQESADD